MKYLKKYNESVNGLSTVKDFIDAINIGLEDNTLFEIERWYKPKFLTEDELDDFRFGIKTDTSSLSLAHDECDLMDRFGTKPFAAGLSFTIRVKLNDNMWRLKYAERPLSVEKKSEIKNDIVQLFHRLGRKYDFTISRMVIGTVDDIAECSINIIVEWT